MEIIDKLVKSSTPPKSKHVIWFNTLDDHYYIYDSDGWVDKGKMIVDDHLSETSENPVQNKVITNKIKNINTEVGEIQSDISSLKGRVGGAEDDITTLENQVSSKASKTELEEAIDESLGKIQDALENLPDGQAVSAQVALNTTAIEELQDDVSQLDTEIYGQEGNCTDGYYLNDQNQLVADENYAVSDYIDVPAGSFQAYYSNNVSLVGRYLCFVNDNDELVSSKQENVAGGMDVDIPEGATKFRFTFVKNYEGTKASYLSNPFYTPVLPKKSLDTKINGVNGNAIAGYSLQSNGELATRAAYGVSDYISVPEGQFTVIYSDNVSLVGSYIVFYDDLNEVVSSVHENVAGGRTVNVPTGATKFRFTFALSCDDVYAAYSGVRFYEAVVRVKSLEEKCNDYTDEKCSELTQAVEVLDEKVSAIPEPDKIADAKLVVTSINLFNKSKVIPNKYIGYSDAEAGLLLDIIDEDIQVSPLIPVVPGNIYYLTRKTGLAHCAQRFVSADGETPIQPLYPDGTTMPWMNNNAPSFAVKAPNNAKYFQFQVKWDATGDVDLTQFEIGSIPTQHTEYSEQKELVEEELPQSVKAIVLENKKRNKCILNFVTRGKCSIISDFDADNNIELDFRLNQSVTDIGYSSNPCFNFLETALIDKESGVKTVIHNCSDDVCPANYNRDNTVGNVGYIGANHAAQCLNICTASSHGKTVADIGSKWSNGTYEFTIVGVPDGNTLWIVGDNFKTYPLYSFRRVGVNDQMTHVSGATHTDGFTVTARIVGQWWYAYGMPNTKVYLDGILVTESGIYSCNELKVCEEYDVLNPASVLSLIQQGVGTFTGNPTPASFAEIADKMVRHSNTYTFSSAAQCFVATSLTTYQNIDDAWFGLTQQGELSGNNKKLYIPEAHVGNVDYRTIVNLADASNSIVKANWEDETFPPNRYLEYSDLVAFNCGYLPISAGENRLNAIGESGVAIYISTTTKMYPNLFYGKSMAAYENYAGVAWRTYIPKSAVNTNGTISINQFDYAGKHYIVADFNSIGVYEIHIPSACSGKKINIIRKRSNVELLTDIPSDILMVKVSSDDVMYGYIVAEVELI